MPEAYPPETLTKSKKGIEEVRALLGRGNFVLYNYLDPKSGKEAEKGKRSLILRDEEGKEEHYFIVPLNEGRALFINDKAEGKERMLWNPKTKKVESGFE